MVARRRRWPARGVWAPLALACLALLAGGHLSAKRVRGDAPTQPQFGDDRFGLNLLADPSQAFLLGTRWVIYDGRDAYTPAPGTIWVRELPLGKYRGAPDSVANQVSAAPGSYWLLGNEPNVRGSDDELSGADYAVAFHDAVAVIKAADPTAVIVAPSILNFDFTCVQCPGYTSGHDWMDAFLAAYQADYGTLPSIDVWSIHTYPLDFANLPQVNAPLMEDQLLEFRSYLDAIPTLQGAPIWDTEVGTAWGYDGLEWREQAPGQYVAYPQGAYRTDLLLNYLGDFVGWLSDNGPALNIQRWFVFASYVPVPEPWESVYGGLQLTDGPGPQAHLTPLGELYRQLAGLPPVSDPAASP